MDETKTVWVVIFYPSFKVGTKGHVSAICATEDIAKQWVKDSVSPDNYDIEQWEIKK